MATVTFELLVLHYVDHRTLTDACVAAVVDEADLAGWDWPVRGDYLRIQELDATDEDGQQLGWVKLQLLAEVRIPDPARVADRLGEAAMVAARRLEPGMTVQRDDDCAIPETVGPLSPATVVSPEVVAILNQLQAICSEFDERDPVESVIAAYRAAFELGLAVGRAEVEAESAEWRARLGF